MRYKVVGVGGPLSGWCDTGPKSGIWCDATKFGRRSRRDAIGWPGNRAGTLSGTNLSEFFGPAGPNHIQYLSLVLSGECTIWNVLL